MSTHKNEKEILMNYIKAGEKYILVTAPAGTGKTYSCIHAAKCYIESGYIDKHQKVLVLTFSRNARAQLIKELMKFDKSDDIYKHIEINNYHSYIKRYLDTYRDIIGIKKPLSLLDEDDFMNMLCQYSIKNNGKPIPKCNAAIFDDYEISEKAERINTARKKDKLTDSDIINIFNCANEFSKMTGNICFSQFGYLFSKLLCYSDGLCTAISHDYPVLILDEYQDTNYYQEKFLRMILKKSRGLFFADNYQMIYEFRGSTIQRIFELKALYPSLKSLEFTEYFRYKDKPDLIEILENIRNGKEIDYSKIVNGKHIKRNIACERNWDIIKNEKSSKAQCTIYCKQIFYATESEVSKLLRLHKSVAILSRKNDVVDKLTEIYFEQGFHPKVVSDTKEMLLINKYLKLIIDNAIIGHEIPQILALCALCTSRMKIDNESISDIVNIDKNKLSRKTKPTYKKIYLATMHLYDSSAIQDKKQMIEIIMSIFSDENYSISFVRKRYLDACLKCEEITSDHIDNILLQRQYISSFTSIKEGLYITTIHQAKGKEFDAVFVVDVDKVKKERNLLYVSHSRMRDRLYPITVNYTGRNYS